MNRRSFFYKVFSDRTNEKIFLGLQIIVLDNAIENLRSKIHSIIETKKTKETPLEKSNFYIEIKNLIDEIIYAAEYGFWELKVHPNEAEDSFNSWIEEIQGSIDEEFNQTEDENDIDRISANKRYISLSLLFLFENTENNNNISENIEKINEDLYNEKSTYIQILSYLCNFDFNYLLGDAIFLVPGNDQDGLSWEDIHSEGWQYLKPIF